jgi:RNA binding domain.
MNIVGEDRKCVIMLLHFCCAAERTALIFNAYVSSFFTAAVPRDHVFFVSFPKEWKAHDITQLFSPFGK